MLLSIRGRHWYKLCQLHIDSIILITVWLCLQLCRHLALVFNTEWGTGVPGEECSFAQTLKDNAFLVGTLLTVTSSLPTKTFLWFPVLTMSDWLFS